MANVTLSEMGIYRMPFDCNIYYGNIVKGDLRSAIAYVKQFQEKINLYTRFIEVFEDEQYITYDIDADLNDILLAYQRYYRDVFYLCIDKEQAANTLKVRLAKLLSIEDEHIELCDMEQKQIVAVFENFGLHFLGGKSSGYYGPYVWRTTETVSYDVELPNGIQKYSVKLLDGFITRSWIDYLSFGEIGAGGWADGDGYINCVKSAWDFESERFRVSLLKHEAQHIRDLQIDKDMSSEMLEYRAKLVELIYSCERNLLLAFSQEANTSVISNGHAMAAHRILKGFSDTLGIDHIQPATIPLEQIQTIAKMLFETSADNYITSDLMDA